MNDQMVQIFTYGKYQSMPLIHIFAWKKRGGGGGGGRNTHFKSYLKVKFGCVFILREQNFVLSSLLHEEK